MGEVAVSTSHNRNSSFDPQFIKKREAILVEGIADRIIGLYTLGSSTREISDWMEENLANRVYRQMQSVSLQTVYFRNRGIENFVYPIVWMDTIHCKVSGERGCAVTRAIYNVLGTEREGHKVLLGMYISRNEGATFGSVF